jgi:hypothetical protein
MKDSIAQKPAMNMSKKKQKKRSPDWQKLLATLISILIMIAQFEAVRLGAWERPNGSHHDDCRSIV